MIKHYGDTTDIEAAARADEYQAKGELDGQRVWMRIAKAIGELDSETGRDEELGILMSELQEAERQIAWDDWDSAFEQTVGA